MQMQSTQHRRHVQPMCVSFSSRVPKTQWIKRIKTYSLPVLDDYAEISIGGSNSNCQQTLEGESGSCFFRLLKSHQGGSNTLSPYLLCLCQVPLCFPLKIICMTAFTVHPDHLGKSLYPSILNLIIFVKFLSYKLRDFCLLHNVTNRGLKSKQDKELWQINNRKTTQ